MPDPWVDRLFGHMAALYGSKFADLWAGTDVASVKAMWAHKLAGFADKPEAIKAALSALDDRPTPPTLPDFLILCREAAKRSGQKQQALPYVPTEADKERLRSAASQAAKAVGMADYDPLTWAKKPKSQKALDMVIDGAKKSGHLRAIFANLVESGIANEAGKLLKRYAGQGKWVTP